MPKDRTRVPKDTTGGLSQLRIKRSITADQAPPSAPASEAFTVPMSMHPIAGLARTGSVGGIGLLTMRDETSPDGKRVKHLHFAADSFNGVTGFSFSVKIPVSIISGENPNSLHTGEDSLFLQFANTGVVSFPLTRLAFPSGVEISAAMREPTGRMTLPRAEQVSSTPPHGIII